MLINFLLAARYTFSGADRGARTIRRYALLLAANAAATVLVVPALAASGMSLVIAKALVLSSLVVLNFISYRAWVFAPVTGSLRRT